MLKYKNDGLKGKNITISGSGNVAQFATEKCIRLGAKVISLSDSSGYIWDSEGIDEEKLAFIMDLKNVKRGRIVSYTQKYPKASFHARKGWP